MFKVECLPPRGSADCPLIRLYDFRGEDIAALRAICESLANGDRDECMLTDEPWARSINGCRLLLRVVPEDQAAPNFASCCTGCRVPFPAPGEPYVMHGSRRGWDDVRELLEPFLAVRHGFNWLADLADVRVLISVTGQW
ncbi:MAG: hypothetical protein U0638_15970 [Phycisphaerales bacterium]